MAHRWPTDGPAHFRAIYAGASNANCTKHHLFGHSKRPATLFREGAKCFISGARMQGRVAFFPPAFTRAHSSANFQQGQTWRTIVASVIPLTLLQLHRLSHTPRKQFTYIYHSKKNFFIFQAGVRYIAEYLAELSAQTGHENHAEELHRSSSNCPPDHVLANLRNFNEGEYPAAPPHQARQPCTDLGHRPCIFFQKNTLGTISRPPGRVGR